MDAKTIKLGPSLFGAGPDSTPGPGPGPGPVPGPDASLALELEAKGYDWIKKERVS